MQPSHALSTAALLLAAGEPILGAPAVVNNIIIPYHTSSSSSSLSPSPRGRFSTTTRRRRLVPSSPPHVVKRAAYAVRANEIVDGETACRDVTVVYARGTTQNGNIGAAGDVGPVFMNALAGLVGAENIAVQGVEYDADISGFLKHLAGTGDEGVEHMASLVTQTVSQCPDTKIVLSGYSQGGQVVHGAADTLKSNQAAMSQIAAVMIFGDPNNGDPVGNISADKVMVICHQGDLICRGTILVLPPHLNYQRDAPTAAKFIASIVQ